MLKGSNFFSGNAFLSGLGSRKAKSVQKNLREDSTAVSSSSLGNLLKPTSGSTGEWGGLTF
jgi:hypothetical protein